jgi:DNA-directed RNA polymerase subunit E"
MSKEKACKICKIIYETEDKCPRCGSKENTNSFKGKIVILNPEKSEIAQKLNMKEKGNFALKTR